MRKNLFSIAKDVLAGGPSAEFTYQDEVLQIRRKLPRARLAQIRAMPLVLGSDKLDRADEQLRKEAETGFEQDWSLL